MSQTVPIISVGFEAERPLSLEFVTALTDPDAKHPDLPNGVRQYQAHAYSGQINVSAIGGGNSVIVLSHPWESATSGSLTEDRITLAKGPWVKATLYLAGIDPRSLDIRSGYEIIKGVGKFQRPTGILVPGAKPTRWEEYTHIFDVRTPLLGGMTIFATQEKVFGPKRQKLELQY